MNFCQKCEKQTPTKVVDEFEECMVCGEIINKPKVKTSINSRLMNDLNRLKHTDKDTGKYTNAKNVGRNVLIGLLIILAGILYSTGGFVTVVYAAIFIIVSLLLTTLIFYVIAKMS